MPETDTIPTGADVKSKTTKFLQVTLARDITGVKLFLKSQPIAELVKKMSREESFGEHYSIDRYAAPPMFRTFSEEISEALTHKGLGDGIWVDLPRPLDTAQAKKLVESLMTQAKALVNDYTSTTRIVAELRVDEPLIRWARG